MITRIWFIKVSPFNTRVRIKPYRPTVEQAALFSHCADGMSEVYEEYFRDTVVPLLKQHGIEEWDFLEEGDEVPHG